jgi:uncharacterized membrane protein YeaQ/YmgE (transglycosylase-associated protein family)
MLYLLFLLIFGFIVGGIAKMLHPGEDPVGFLPTVGIGIVGSYIGGFISWLIYGGTAIHMSGLIFGVLGGVIFLSIWRWWKLQSAQGGPRSFWTGKHV